MVRTAALAIALALPVGLVLGTTPSAVADATPPPPPPPPGGNDGATSDSATQDYQWRNCHIVSGPQYIGGVCAGSSSDGKTPKEILGDEPVPDCWDEAVTDPELAAMGKANVPGPGGITYYWHSCLSGIDKKTKKVEPGGIQIKTWLIHLDNGTPPQTLLPNQQILVNSQKGHGVVPDPVAVSTPADHPRVGLDVAFVNGGDGELNVSPFGAVIHAYVDHTWVEPLGAGLAPKIGCPGNGTPAEPGQQRAEGDGLCWYRYLHSSAGQPEGKYQAQITAHWVV